MRNPQRGIQNLILSWITLHVANRRFYPGLVILYMKTRQFSVGHVCSIIWFTVLLCLEFEVIKIPS